MKRFAIASCIFLTPLAVTGLLVMAPPALLLCLCVAVGLASIGWISWQLAGII